MLAKQSGVLVKCSERLREGPVSAREAVPEDHGLADAEDPAGDGYRVVKTLGLVLNGIINFGALPAAG
jgi:hypothetical protein